MVWSLKDSQLIYDELRAISAQVLKALGCHTEPHKVGGKGTTRTKSWLEIDGRKRYQGVLFHYTNGVSGVGAVKWANHPGWGNTGSSWHVTIFDRITDNIVGEIWSKIDDEIRRLFPVPTIIMADFRWGTWHGNWTNNVTLGIENRNGGYSGYSKAKNGLETLNKQGVDVHGKIWEIYTREQMACNVNLGRLANGLIEGQLDPDWVLSHQCVWATKQDTGPLFTIHEVRNAIFNNDPLISIPWLSAYPMAPDTNEDDDTLWDPLDEFRDEAEENFMKWTEPSPEVVATTKDPVDTALLMYRLGFNTGPEVPAPDSLKKQVRWFQRSTGAYAKDHPERVLSPDGVAGPKTHKELKRRIDQLKLG